MGDVLYAEDTTLKRPVAIKRVKAGLLENDEIRQRVERETLLQARIGAHPHIATLYERIDLAGGELLIVMEYIDGETLKSLLERVTAEGRALTIGEIINIADQVLQALSHIHSHGIIHRDIKPGNIMVRRDAEGKLVAKLLDFGIARHQADTALPVLTREGGSTPGTPLYMAPEQIDPAQFGEATPATDIYALGVILYQMVAGHPPFAGTLTEVMNAHLVKMPPPISIPKEAAEAMPIGGIILKALSKLPAERYHSARAMRDALNSLLTHLTASRIQILEAKRPSSTMIDTTEAMAAADGARTVVSAGAQTVIAGAVPSSNVEATRLADGSAPNVSTRAGLRNPVLVLLSVGAILLFGAMAVLAVIIRGALMSGAEEGKPPVIVSRERPQPTPTPAPTEATVTDLVRLPPESDLEPSHAEREATPAPTASPLPSEAPSTDERSALDTFDEEYKKRQAERAKSGAGAPTVAPPTAAPAAPTIAPAQPTQGPPPTAVPPSPQPPTPQPPTEAPPQPTQKPPSSGPVPNAPGRLPGRVVD